MKGPSEITMSPAGDSGSGAAGEGRDEGTLQAIASATDKVEICSGPRTHTGCCGVVSSRTDSGTGVWKTERGVGLLVGLVWCRQWV